MSIRLEQRSDPADFFALVEARRDQLGPTPLLVREVDQRGEWCVVASLALVPIGLRKIHSLQLITPVGHHLPNVDPEDAWPTHAAAIIGTRDLVPVLRAGASDLGLDINQQLDLTDRYSPDHRAAELLGPFRRFRLGAALAWKRQGAA